ncbi:hypothetical protein DFR67_103167 [Williamsia limnetica]|uniref:Uncharacterized protein n=1 Tax=Williamsia limnetica TaxID=882452 RepID=A0A318RQ87_WILLI|nr:hypothetical protein [Williamsia limnetica]PYE19256.1 hypothetical protein DFR67_103167 [Williamsia limnetica]
MTSPHRYRDRNGTRREQRHALATLDALAGQIQDQGVQIHSLHKQVEQLVANHIATLALLAEADVKAGGGPQ